MGRDGEERRRHGETPHAEEKKVASSRMNRSSSKSCILLSFKRLSTSFSSFFHRLFSPPCRNKHGKKSFSFASSSVGSSACSDFREKSSSSLSPLHILGWYTQITDECGNLLYALSGISPSASTEERQQKFEKERKEDGDPLKKTTRREGARDDREEKSCVESCPSSLLNFPLPIKGLLHALIQSSLLHLHFYPSFFSVPVTPSHFDDHERYDSFSSDVYTPGREKKEYQEEEDERLLKDRIEFSEEREGEKSATHHSCCRKPHRMIVHSGYRIMHASLPQDKSFSSPSASSSPSSAYPNEETASERKKRKEGTLREKNKKSKEREGKTMLSERHAIMVLSKKKDFSKTNQRKKKEDKKEEKEEERRSVLMDQKLFIFFLFVRETTDNEEAGIDDWSSNESGEAYRRRLSIEETIYERTQQALESIQQLIEKRGDIFPCTKSSPERDVKTKKKKKKEEEKSRSFSANSPRHRLRLIRQGLKSCLTGDLPGRLSLLFTLLPEKEQEVP